MIADEMAAILTPFPVPGVPTDGLRMPVQQKSFL
jgi:hypothetical protein